MKKENKKIFIVLILIFLTLVFAGVMTFLSCDKVYADAYSDNAIVNFNQLITTQLNYTNTSVDVDRTYFNCIFLFNNAAWSSIAITNSGVYDLILTASTTYTANIGIKHSGQTQDLTIYNQSNFNVINGHKYYFRINVLSSNPSVIGGLVVKDFIVIDLTQMFTENLEPNIEQCRQIFTSPYYNYNEGTPLYLNGINAYNDGMNAVLDSLRVNVNDYVIGYSSFPYSNDTIKRGEFVYDSTINHYTFSGVLGVILMTDIKAGTNVNANFELWIPDIQGENDNYAYSFKLNFGYVINNNLVPLVEITANKRNNTSLFYEGTFNMPIDTNTLYLWVDYSTSDSETPTQIIAINSELTYRTLETTSLLASQYTKGFNDAKREYEPGGQLYQNIYNLGFAAGSNNAANGSIFTDGWQWLGTMFHSLGEILNIQFLPGLSIGIFVALPLLVGLVSFILKITKGSGD